MADLARLDEYAADVLHTGSAPALAVALPDRERTLAVRTYGQASPETLWPIGSIGKSIAAVIALQLVDEGVLALDRPITRDLPWFALRSELGPITLHHLLTHTAGLIATSDLAPASGYDVIALAETEPGFAPGEHRLYLDVGYRTIGVLLERVTGRAFPVSSRSACSIRSGSRLGARDRARHPRRLPGGHVPFYDDRPWRPEHGLVPAPWIESAEAEGCECCTPEDLACFLRALWRGDPLIRTPQPPVGDADYEYGYGLVIEPGGFGHGGDMPGYVSHMWADDASGHGVVAFANGIAGAFALGEAALALARGDEPDPWSPELAEPLVDDGSCPPAWQPYLGRYRSHNPWRPTFLVAAREGELVLGTDWLDSERLPLAPLGDPVFRVGEPPWSPERLRFDTHRDGRAQRATLSGMPYYRAFGS